MTRSSSAAVGAFGERLVCERLGLTPAAPGQRGYDAVGADGSRVKVKTRRVTARNPARKLGCLRGLEERRFDALVTVQFDEGLRPLGMWQVPHDVVVRHARWEAHGRAHRVTVTRRLLVDPAVRRLA